MERCLALSKLQTARSAHLHLVPPCARVLMLGEGPGRLLEALVQKMPSADFVVVDQSQQMIEQAKRALIASGFDVRRITWEHGDVFELGFEKGSFDLVTTPFFLDCFTQSQLRLLIPRIANVCNPDAFWLLTDFQIPATKGWQQARAKWIHWLMYLFFRKVTSIAAENWIDPDAFISAAGFELSSRKESNAGLIRSDIWKRGNKSMTMRAGAI